MAKNELYTIRTQPQSVNDWKVLKVDADFNPTGSYDVSKTGNLFNCSCFAGNKPVCRHRSMILEFTVMRRLDSHWFFDFDRRQWIEGPKHEE